MYEKFQNGSENKNLLEIHKLIKDAKTEDDIKNVYNMIYGLYLEKMEKDLNINEDIEGLFYKYSRQISYLQKIGLFNEQDKSYLPKLEEIIKLYNEREKDFESRVDGIFEYIIQKNIESGRTPEMAKRSVERISSIYKEKLHKSKDRISHQREEDGLFYRISNKQEIVHNQNAQIADLKRTRDNI